MDAREFINQWVSPFLTGPEVEALLGTIADEIARGEQLSVDVNDQLSISTAVGPYLDKRLAELDIKRPSEIGISDEAFRSIGITVNASKQLASTVHDLLEIFYGPSTVRAWAQSGKPEPYALEDGMTLTFMLDDNTEHLVTFPADEFVNIQAATAEEVSGFITRALRDAGHQQALSLAFTDPDTQEDYVRIFGLSKGPFSFVQVTGGEAQNVMEFPEIRDTQLTVENTVWQVTRNYGQTLRFRWDGGNAPKLGEVLAGDRVLIYGQQFQALGLGGTFTVTAVRPPKPAVSYDSGWFEITNDLFTTLLSSQPNVAPPPNSPGFNYSLSATQGAFDDMKFFLPLRRAPYSEKRFTAGFEPEDKLLRIYLPAVTQVVERNLVGGAYLHSLYPSTDFDGSYGSATDPSAQLQIINEYVIRYPQERLDNYGTGGTLTLPGPVVVEVEQAWRENGYAYVRTVTPHGITGYESWTTAVDYSVGDEAVQAGIRYRATQASGPGNGGARQPILYPLFWEQVGPAITYSDVVVGLVVENVRADDPNKPYPGPYLADLTTTFNMGSQITKLREPVLKGQSKRSLTVLGELPNSPGKLVIDLSQETEEQPVTYIAVQPHGAPAAIDILSISQNGFRVVVTTDGPHGVVPGDQVVVAGTSMDDTYVVDEAPSPNVWVATSTISQVDYDTGGTSTLVDPGPISTLVLDPAYIFKKNHAIGADATLLNSATTFVPSPDGSDYSNYITSTPEAREYCRDVVEAILALGIRLEVIVIYPSGEGLGNYGYPDNEEAVPHSEIVEVYGVDNG